MFSQVLNLSTEKLETQFNPNKGVYETSPIIKANGGVLLLDDLGRQKEDHNAILNRMIVPLENKRDVIYIKGAPVIVHTQFIPILSTNLDINIVDEAHLRRAPMHILPGEPPTLMRLWRFSKETWTCLMKNMMNQYLKDSKRFTYPHQREENS